MTLLPAVVSGNFELVKELLSVPSTNVGFTDNHNFSGDNLLWLPFANNVVQFNEF